MTYAGHEVLTETLNVPYGPDRYSAMKHDFLLKQLATTPANLSQSSPTPPCNHSSQLEADGAVTGPTWAGLSAGLGLVAALRSLND